MFYFDSVCSRISLAGSDYFGYDRGVRGTISKICVVIASLSLITLPVLAIKKVVQFKNITSAIIILSIATTIFFLVGSSEKRSRCSCIFQVATSATCIAFVILYNTKKMTPIKALYALLGTTLGCIFLGSITDKSMVIPFELDQTKTIDLNKPESMVLSEEEIQKVRSYFPVQILDFFLGFGRDVTFALRRLLSWLTHFKNYQSTLPEKENSIGLVALLPGLRVPESMLDGMHDVFEKTFPKAILFQPKVHNRGNCALDETVNSIYPEFKKFAQMHPQLPICLIGLSNGGRIAAEIAVRLEVDGFQNPVQIHCIGAPFLGTKIINQPSLPQAVQNQYKKVFLTVGYQKSIVDELTYQSDVGKALVQKILNGKWESFFYIGGVDWMIVPHSCALPRKAGKTFYFFGPTAGHGGMTSSAEPIIIEKASAFLKPKV